WKRPPGTDPAPDRPGPGTSTLGFVARALRLVRTGRRPRASAAPPVQSLPAGRRCDLPPCAPPVRHWQNRVQNLRRPGRQTVQGSRGRGVGGQSSREGNGEVVDVSYSSEPSLFVYSADAVSVRPEPPSTRLRTGFDKLKARYAVAKSKGASLLQFTNVALRLRR